MTKGRVPRDHASSIRRRPCAGHRRSVRHGLCPGSRADRRARPDQPAGAVLQSDEPGRHRRGREGRRQARDLNANNDPRRRTTRSRPTSPRAWSMIVVAIDVNGVMPAVQQAADAGSGARGRCDPARGPAQEPDRGRQRGRGRRDRRGLPRLRQGDGRSARSASSARSTRSSRTSGRRASRTPSRAMPTLRCGRRRGRNIQDNALAAAETLITGNPDMTAVYATGEPALVGAVAAVEAQGRPTGSKSPAGIDRAGDQGNRRRVVIAVVQKDPERMGAVASSWHRP